MNKLVQGIVRRAV